MVALADRLGGFSRLGRGGDFWRLARQARVLQAAIAFGIAVFFFAFAAKADDEVPLYFHFSAVGVPVPGGVSTLFVDQTAPTSTEGTKLDLSSPQGTKRSFPPFLSSPFSQPLVLPRASGVAHAYLAVNQRMVNCADIFFDLYKNGAGGLTWLGGGVLEDQTILQRTDGALNVPFDIPYSIQAPLADRTVAVGEGLAAVLSIGNSCSNNKGVDLWFDGASVPTNTGGVDNCPSVPNPDQADLDDDGLGDACDSCTDFDGDGFGDPGHPANTCADDNCPSVFNADQSDFDGDGTGDACDPCTDTDGDGFGNPGFPASTCPLDNCPDVPGLDQSDGDGDGIGNLCDNCVDHPNLSQVDADGDGIGDDCECTAPAPGICFWGGGTNSSDCKLEWLVSPAQAPDQKGRLMNKAECRDGAPCDGDGTADGVCTFRVSLCINNHDPRMLSKAGVPVCDPDEVVSVDIEQKCDRRGGCTCTVADKICDPEQSALEGTIHGLPSGATDRCFAPVAVTVPLKGPTGKGIFKKGQKKITAVAQTAPNSKGKPGQDKDSLVLICLP